MLLATPGLSWFPARSTGDTCEPIPTALAGAQEIDGRNALRGLTAGAVEHSLAMQPTDWVGRNRHQPAEDVTIPADIPCGAEAAQERPLGVNDALSHRTHFIAIGVFRATSRNFTYLCCDLPIPRHDHRVC